MADSSGMADIRGLNVDKLMRGLVSRAMKLRNFLGQSTTKAREIRWFQITAGILDSTDTTGMTSTRLWPVPHGATPEVVEPTFTRNTSYAKKFFVESPTISIEDIKDSDVDIFAMNMRKLAEALASQVDTRCYNVITESLSPSNIQTVAATADGWDDVATGDPIADLLAAKRMIYAYDYNPEGAVLYINPVEYENLIKFLISVKGSSIPQVASEKVMSGVVTQILGLKVVVSNNATTDYALVFVPNVAATWKSFIGTTTKVVDDPGIGKKIRIWEEGEALLTDPKAVVLITDTVV